MKKLLLLIGVLLSTGCATFQLSTLNHESPYSIEGSDVEVQVIDNEFQLRRLLRDDFRFRYDFAQYAMRQPMFWHYNNRFFNYRLSNRYSWFNGHQMGYMNASQMWNNWLWGYPNNYGMGWSYSWNNNSWNNWGSPFGNNVGWNGWGNGYGHNGWHQIYGRQQNVSYNVGRRGSNSMSQSDRQGIAAMIETSKRNKLKPRVNVDNKIIPIINNNNNNTRPTFNNTRPRINNSRPTFNNTKPVINNTRPRVNNSRPIINRTTPTRTNSKPSRNNTTNNRRKN